MLSISARLEGSARLFPGNLPSPNNMMLPIPSLFLAIFQSVKGTPILSAQQNTDVELSAAPVGSTCGKSL
ncbi:uncharacterized [Tachysurus ichikawai]